MKMKFTSIDVKFVIGLLIFIVNGIVELFRFLPDE